MYWNSLTNPESRAACSLLIFFITQFAHPSLLIDRQLEVLGISAAGLSQCGLLDLLASIFIFFSSTIFLLFVGPPIRLWSPPWEHGYSGGWDGPLSAGSTCLDRRQSENLLDGKRVHPIPSLFLHPIFNRTDMLCRWARFFFLNHLRSGRCNLRGIVDIGYLQPLSSSLSRSYSVTCFLD